VCDKAFATGAVLKGKIDGMAHVLCMLANGISGMHCVLCFVL
jgi:hypothetical protein